MASRPVCILDKAPHQSRPRSYRGALGAMTQKRQILFAVGGDRNELIVHRKPRVVNQANHLLLTQLHLIGKLLDRLRPRIVNVVPDAGAELLVFFDVHG